MSVHYNGYVEASSQGYIMGTKGHLMTVHYNGYVEASMQGSSTGTMGTS
jgi:hypothetical protein